MRGSELRAARGELGWSESQLAEAVDARPEQVFEWERTDAKTPRDVASVVRHAVFGKRAAELLAASGLPECQEAARLDEQVVANRFKGADMEAALGHERTCQTCRARSDYVRERLGEAPALHGGLWLVDRLGWLWTQEGWRGSAAAGIAFVLALVAIGVILTVVMAAVRRDWHYLLWTAALLGVAVFGGGAGGLVWGWTARMRSERAPGYIVSGVLAGYGYITGTGAFLYSWLRAAGDTLPEAGELRELFADPVGALVAAAITGLLLGGVLGWQLWKDRGAATDADADERLHTDGRRRELFKALAVMLVLAVGLTLTRGAGRATDRQAEVDAHYALGRRAVRLHRAGDAVAHFEVVVGRLPRGWQGHAALGNAQALHRDYDAALPHLERAVRLAPNVPFPRFYLGRLLARMERYEAAAAEFEALLPQADDEPAALWWYALVLKELGRGDQGLRLLEGAAERHSDQAVRWANVASYATRLARHADALRAARRLVDGDAENAGAWGLLAHTAYAAADFATSRQALARAQRLDPDLMIDHPEARDLERALRDLESP
jgi:tetratricopeptide (TPR) repeat protein